MDGSGEKVYLPQLCHIRKKSFGRLSKTILSILESSCYGSEKLSELYFLFWPLLMSGACHQLCIVDEFFRKNQAALLYICETGDGMQKMRSRLFSYWFSVYAENDDFLFLPQVVYDEEENENYAALIIRRDNPLFNDLVSEFTKFIGVAPSGSITNNPFTLVLNSTVMV